MIKEHIKAEYRAAADALRSAPVDTPELIAHYVAARAAYRAAFPVVVRVARGWYDLPIAAQMWAADGRALNA